MRLALAFKNRFKPVWLSRTSGNKERAHGLAVQETVVVNLELVEDVVNLGGGELVSPLGQGPSVRALDL